MNFNESLKYLYGLGYELSVKKFGLGNTVKLLKAIENPEENYLKIQIAGTNGKGSACAFLEAILISAGIKVGKYTSPHLVSVTERIRIDGREISEARFADYATRVRKVSEKLVERGELEALPTFFEQVTAICLKFFADEAVEVAILETGIGGRFDSTTAASAEIVAITPVDFDHQHILGNTLAEIAAEKAAVIRPGTNVVLAVQPEEALNVILGRCSESGVSPSLTSSVEADSDLEFHISNFKSKRSEYNNVRLGLAGKHQIENAKVAVLLAESLQESFRITSENVIEGLQAAKHKGRLEYYKNILFDGAHNISGAKALREYLDEFVAKPITMIFGSMKEKDLAEIGRILFPKAEKLILTRPDNPRSMDVAELAGFVPAQVSKEKLFLADSAVEALRIAAATSGDANLVLVTGSLYLVGEVQKIMNDGSGI